jgi:hypothetical protein
MQSVEQLNYAHITIQKGDVTYRNIEHEFNVLEDSMKINWRLFPKVVSPTEFRTKFRNAKSLEELVHLGKLFTKIVPNTIISLKSGLVILSLLL